MPVENERFEICTYVVTIMDTFTIHLGFLSVMFVEDGKSLNQSETTNMMTN